LTANARDVIGLSLDETKDTKKVKLKSDEIETSKNAADLDLTCDDVMKELKNNDKS
jgi:hypothetical protein